MTLLTENSDIQYAGLIGQTTFAYNFRVDLITDMNVTLDGVPVGQGNFTMTGLGTPSGGNVILNTGLVVDALVVLQRIVPATQEVDYQPFDAFPAETHEGALDKLTMLIQQGLSSILRSLRFPVGDPADPILPDVATRANKFLAFDAVGDLAVLSGTGGGDPNAVQKPASAVTAGNIIEFDALKNAVDAGENVTTLKQYVWPDTGTIIELRELGGNVNKFKMTTGASGSPVIFEQIGADDSGIVIEDVLILNGRANFIAGEGITLNGKTDVLGYYEQGTWLPSIQDSTNSNAEGQTYNLQQGHFTRIGDMVFLMGEIDLSSYGTLTGDLYIADFPFPTAINATASIGSGPITKFSNTNLAAGVSIMMVGGIGVDRMELHANKTAGQTNTLQIADINNNLTVAFTAFYKTNSIL